MKKTMILFIFLILIGYSIYYNRQYNVKYNKQSIQKYVKTSLNFGEDSKMNPIIIDVEQLGDSNTVIATFKLSTTQNGYAVLKKGLNKKMKIVRTRYGNGKVAYSGIETNKGKYGLLTGINVGLKVDHVTVKLLNHDYFFIADVPMEKYFIIYKKLPKEIKEPFPADLIFYDKHNNVLPRVDFN